MLSLVKWAPPHGTVVLMSRQPSGDIWLKQTKAELPFDPWVNWIHMVHDPQHIFCTLHKISFLRQIIRFKLYRLTRSSNALTFNPIECGGGAESAPPYHINVVPRKMLKEKVANFL